MSRIDDLNEKVQKQTADRFAKYLRWLVDRPERLGRPLTESDRYLAAQLACRNRSARRRDQPGAPSIRPYGSRQRRIIKAVARRVELG